MCSLEVESLINTCCGLHKSSVEEFSVCTFKISLIQVTAHEFLINFGYLTSDDLITSQLTYQQDICKLHSKHHSEFLLDPDIVRSLL